jgi:alkylation response protein AidB-like acyl-CoA dehydrogenase
MPAPSDRARELAGALRLDAAETDHEGGFPAHSIALLHNAGLLTAALPSARGGESLGEANRGAELLRTLAVIGRGSLVAGRLFEGHVNALQLIDRYGSEAQRARAADDARQGRLFGVWNTEAEDGVKLARQGESYLLSGSKTFASGLGHVERAIVTASVDDGAARGQQMLLLALDERPPIEDRSFWRPLGMRASASYRAGFDGCHVGRDEFIGTIGDYYRQPTFGVGAIRFAAVQLGGAEAIFDETRRFLRELGRTADPFQRARVGEMAWRIEAGRLWLSAAGAHSSQALRGPIEADDRASERMLAYANMMRSAIEDVCLRIIELAERSIGARGLLRPEPVERMHRDLAHYLRQPAPDAALVQAGRHVLCDARTADSLWTPCRDS